MVRRRDKDNASLVLAKDIHILALEKLYKSTDLAFKQTNAELTEAERQLRESQGELDYLYSERKRLIGLVLEETSARVRIEAGSQRGHARSHTKGFFQGFFIGIITTAISVAWGLSQ